MSLNEDRLRDAYAIFDEVFSAGTSYETFRHKHFENPYIHEELVNFVSSVEGVPAGTNSFLGDRMICKNKVLNVVQSCDSAVKPCFRGKHIFSNIILHALEICRESGVDLMFGFPGEQSYPGFMKMGFYEVGKLSTYVAVIHPFSLVRRMVTHQAKKFPPFKEMILHDRDGYTWEMTTCCPFSDKEIADMNAQSGVHMLRSREMFKWKIDDLPAGDGIYLCARKEGKLCAHFIFQRKRGGERGYLCDFGFPSDGKGAGHLLRRALRLVGRSCEVVLVPFVNQFGMEPRLLTRCGVLPTWKKNTLIFFPTTNVLDEEVLSYLKDIRNWKMRYMDLDMILN